ncbi:MAG: M3 family oligoendopeptidase [Candidatus Hermodarchaeota archaeon]
MTDEKAWDLSPLVENTEPAKVKEMLDEAVTKANDFEAKYKGKIATLDAKGVLELYKEIEQENLRREGAFLYGQLKYAADMTDLVAKDLNDYTDNIGMQISKMLAFVDLELGQLLKNNPKLIEDPVLSEYNHALEKLNRRIPYQLSEIEEQLIIEKDRFGINAWSQLQSEWVSTRKFEIEIDGETQTLPYGKIIGLYQSPDRDLRRKANSIVYSNLGKDHILWASALRSICSDHLMQVKRRNWPAALTQSLISNDVNQETIESLMKTIKNNVSVYQRYLKLKAKIMGLPKLGNWDIVAPLPNSPEQKFTWAEAQELVVTSYSSFDAQSGEWINEMFEKRRIDGAVREGKQTGAWCASWLSGKSAWILCSFNEKLGDVYTLAHENGHALHDYLMSRAQTPVNCRPSFCTAEGGSIFGELIITEKLLAEAKTDNEKIAIICHVLDEFGMSAFQVSARYFFEQSMYDCIEKGDFLDGEKIAELWVKARDDIYGDVIEWLEEMKWEWTMKSHYFMPRFRFYNYPYVFAQLFVFALYEKYQQEGEAFAPKFKQFLASGSSKSPQELAAEIGFDLTDPKFWQLGIKQAERFVNQLEKLV